MLNKESRKYFTRAYLVSSSVFSKYVISEANNVKQVQNCAQMKDDRQLIDYLKTANASVLKTCDEYEGRLITKWKVTIEHPDAIEAFITKTPDDIYSSGEVSAIDAVFSFASAVNRNKQKQISFDQIIIINQFIIS